MQKILLQTIKKGRGKMKNFVKVLVASLLLVACLSSFVGCGQGDVTYKLEQYQYRNVTYGIGDSFYGVEITSDLVVVELNGDGSAKLTISKAFIQGNPAYADSFEVYDGTWSETEGTISALFPSMSTTPLSCLKTGDMISIALSSKETIILKK